MSKPPRITIVTPSFNQGRFLEECIDSVLSQGYPDLEYIVMDGGSTDGSVEIIRKYERHLAYWQSAPDGGQYVAIDAGFQRSTGAIMAWLNSDDKFQPRAFYKVAYALESHPEVEWLTGRPVNWNAQGGVEEIWLAPLPIFTRASFMRKDCFEPCIQQESTFWRRSLWDRAGGRLRTDLALAGDLELWMRFLRSSPHYSIDTLLAGHRRHEAQKTRHFMDRYLEEARMVLDEEAARFPQAALDSRAPAPIRLGREPLNAFIKRCYDTSGRLDNVPSDGPDEVIELLVERLRVSEADRAARLEVISDLHAAGAKLHTRMLEMNEDLDARLRLIEQLGAKLQETDAQLAERWQKTHSLEEELFKVRASLAYLEKVHGELEGALDAVLSSSSWKVTRPLRWVLDKTKR